MPGPYSYPSRPPCSKSPSSVKTPKKLKAPMGAPAAEKGEADAKRSSSAPMRNVKIRVICTDPDATDSSSDEDVDVKPSHVRVAAHKRVVRELLLPANLSLPPSLPGNPGEGYVDAKLPLHKQRRCMGNYGSHMGASQRRCDKWAAEIRGTPRGVRVWLGTLASPETAAQDYDDAALNIKTPEAAKNLSSLRKDSQGADSCFTSAASKAGNSANELMASLAVSENAESAGSCFLVNSTPSVLGPDSTFPAFLCFPYGTTSKRCFSDAFSNECSDDSMSDVGHKDRESKMTDFSLISDDASQQNTSLKPNRDEEVKLELGAEASILPSSFTDGMSCFDELGQFLGNDSECMNDVPDVRVDFDISLADTDINFELDTEALSWINVSDSWMCAR